NCAELYSRTQLCLSSKEVFPAYSYCVAGAIIFNWRTAPAALPAVPRFIRTVYALDYLRLFALFTAHRIFDVFIRDQAPSVSPTTLHVVVHNTDSLHEGIANRR